MSDFFIYKSCIMLNQHCWFLKYSSKKFPTKNFVQKISSNLKSTFKIFFGNFFSCNNHLRWNAKRRSKKLKKSYGRTSTHGFTYAKVKNPIFDSKIEVFVGNFDIILKDLGSSFCSTIKIWVKFILTENPKIPRIQPNNDFFIEIQVNVKNNHW